MRKMFPIYEKIAELGLLAVFHGGWDPYADGEVRATPQRFAALCEKFPHMTVIAAHLGGIMLWDDVEKHLAGRFDDLYLDVSVISRYIDREQLLRIIRQQGAEKILFGSDCPWDEPANEIAMINELPLSAEEKELIFHKNAEKLIS